MCEPKERRRIREEFNKLIDDVELMENKFKALEEYLNIEHSYKHLSIDENKYTKAKKRRK